MSKIRPILFNTEMVRAIMDSRKTATRRVIKQEKYLGVLQSPSRKNHPEIPDEYYIKRLVNPPCEPGDILYIREAWAFWPCIECMAEETCNKTSTTHEDNEAVTEGCYIYRADHPHPERITWRPSIHMPKAAARIWLRVTDVRVERLLEVTNPIKYPAGKDNTIIREGFKYTCDFIARWNSTIKKTDLDKYGWNADPWVWVIEFERCEQPEPCILRGIEPASDTRPCIGYQKSQTNDEPCEMCKGCRMCNGEDPEVENV